MNADPDIRHRDATCGTCGKAFRAAMCFSPFDSAKVLFAQKHCDPCVVAENERIRMDGDSRRRLREQADATAEWERICPHEFRAVTEGGPTSVERLKAEQPLMESILAHPFGSRGLILRGDTGSGKTRGMYRLLRRYFDQNRSTGIVALTAGEVDRPGRDAAGDFSLSRWFKRLATAPALFIDDLGKGKWTPSTSGQFWELVDDRTRNGRPIFITTNFSGAKLVAQLGLDADNAEPLLRRLREHCDVIVLKPHTTTK